MLRYLRRLSDLDVALDRSMIPLGSCTMKLNATAEMEAITWPEFANLHPFAPEADAAGYAELIGDLERWLCAVTGYDACSVRRTPARRASSRACSPSAPTTRSRGDAERDVCLIPESAHGTNARQRGAGRAARGRGQVRPRRGDRPRRPAGQAGRARRPGGRRSWSPTRPPTASTRPPSSRWRTSCTQAGGQVYIDGANLNALAGLTSPALIGGDVSHLNLHKTFCIPHGGGGPGVGPVVAQGAPGPVPARRGRLGRHRHGGQVRLRGRAADLLGLHRDDGRRGAAGGDPDGGAVRQLHRPPARPVLPGRLHRAARAGRARVHRRPAPACRAGSPWTTWPSG